MWHGTGVWHGYFYPRILVLGMGSFQAAVAFLAWINRAGLAGLLYTTLHLDVPSTGNNGTLYDEGTAIDTKLRNYQILHIKKTLY